MTRSRLLVASLAAALLAIAPRAVVAQADEPATGFAVWARVSDGSVQDLANSAVGGPRFAIGFRRDRLTLGLGLGLSKVRSTEKQVFDPQTSSEDKTTATAFQLGPSALFEVWRSADGRARGQIAAGLAVGRVSVTETSVFRDASGTSTSRTETSGTLVGVHIALGGEHFLHPHFALGLEGGFQTTFAFDVEEKVTGGTGSTLSLGATGAYGALRAMVVFGSR
ncbi:MAG: hypothetical protein ACREMC_04795 [Gemmatimonadales bacterium]